MSKYIIDTDDFEPLFKVDSIGVFGIGKSLSDSDEDHSWSRIKSIEEFEELNSDYINEHFGGLQDTAYQKGFEDGKAVNDKGCEGCKYANVAGTHEPCVRCSNSYGNQWTAKDDKPIIGEVVERYLNGKRDGIGMFLGEDGDYWNCLFWTGAIFGTFAYPSNQFKRTGNVCDITKILEAMKA